MLQGDFASSGRAEKLLSSCNPRGEPHCPIWLKIPMVSACNVLPAYYHLLGSTPALRGQSA